jgi:hypothetical protein
VKACAILLLLCSCTGMQVAGTNKAGNPYAFQVGTIMAKAKGAVMKIKNGPIELEQVFEEPDSTEVPKQVSSDLVTYGAASLLNKQEVNKDNNSASVEKQRIKSNEAIETTRLDNEAIGIKSAGTVNEIEAKQ